MVKTSELMPSRPISAPWRAPSAVQAMTATPIAPISPSLRGEHGDRRRQRRHRADREVEFAGDDRHRKAEGGKADSGKPLSTE